MNCLLCKSEKIVILESYSKASLEKLWKYSNISVGSELKKNSINLFYCENCCLKFFDPILAGGDKFYSELGKLDWYYLHSGKTEYDYIQKYIKAHDKILDIGAGRGVLYKKIKCTIDYTGIDLSTKAVALAKDDGINVKYENLPKHALNNKNKYDIVCLFQVLEHLTELNNFLKDVKSVMKPKGLFVIAVPDNGGFISFTSNYTFNLPPHHTILWTEDSLRHLAVQNDFEIINIKRELLQEVHEEIAYKSYIISRAKKLIFRRGLLIDDSRTHQAVSRIISKLYHTRLLQKLILPGVKRKQVYGQSIFITLQKK